jgi:hypothetical protein
MVTIITLVGPGRTRCHHLPVLNETKPKLKHRLLALLKPDDLPSLSCLPMSRANLQRTWSLGHLVDVRHGLRFLVTDCVSVRGNNLKVPFDLRQ